MRKTFLPAILLTMIYLLCAGQAMAADPQAAPEGFVKLAITGTNVFVRPLPQASGPFTAKASTGDVFIAEQWPVENETDYSQWYRIIFAIKNDGSIVPLASLGEQFKTGFFPFVSANFAKISPLTPQEDARAKAIPYREGFSYDLGNSLPDIAQKFGPGEIKRGFDLEAIKYFGGGHLLTTHVKLPGLEGLIFEDLDMPYDIHGKSFTLSKPGVIFQGIAIATPGFGRKEVRKLMAAEWPNIQPQISTEEGLERWYYGAEMWHCFFIFDEQGLVKSYEYYYTTG